MNILENEKWDMIIEPKRGLLDLRWRELWQYRDLVMLFVRRDFVVNAGLFGKVYFPRLAVPVSILISNLITFVIQFGVQLLMYFTAVIYPVSSIPERFNPYILANPMTSIVEAFRFAFLGAGMVNYGPHPLQLRIYDRGGFS
jgi:ABC-type polysaccharide/polyol phosphate export permease